MRHIQIITLIIFVVLAACSPASASLPTDEPDLDQTRQPDEASDAGTEAATPQETTPVPTETPLSNEMSTAGGTEADLPTKTEVLMEKTVLIYRRAGGIAGINEEWLIYPDGRVEGPSGESWQVEPEEVQELLDAVDDAGFLGLEDSYVPLDTCCDRFSYAISARIDDEVKTVTTIDASPDQPEQMTMVMELIGEFLSQFRE